MHVNMVSLVVLLLSVDLSAAIFYQQPLPETRPSGYKPSSVESQQTADDFTLSSAATLAGVKFWGFYWNPGVNAENEAFSIRLYLQNAEGTGPATTPFQTFGNQDLNFTRRDTGLVYGSGATAKTIYEYQVDLNNTISLSASETPYYISILDARPYDGNPLWWAPLDGTGSAWMRYGDDAWQSAAPGNLAFALSDTPFNISPVPEPALYVTLVAMSLLVFASCRALCRNDGTR